MLMTVPAPAVVAVGPARGVPIRAAYAGAATVPAGAARPRPGMWGRWMLGTWMRPSADIRELTAPMTLPMAVWTLPMAVSTVWNGADRMRPRPAMAVRTAPMAAVQVDRMAAATVPTASETAWNGADRTAARPAMTDRMVEMAVRQVALMAEVTTETTARMAENTVRNTAR